MATKSIYKCIVIKDKKKCNTLIRALENAKVKPERTIVMQRTVSKPDKEQLRTMFGKNAV